VWCRVLLSLEDTLSLPQRSASPARNRHHAGLGTPRISGAQSMSFAARPGGGLTRRAQGGLAAAIVAAVTCPSLRPLHDARVND
jgi:hypothetical protein